jgi:glycogen operon protein
LYERSGRTPGSSINYITAHDGFTLNDLVSYRNKHNEANGHRNQDGDDNNLSDNYGVEGHSPDKAIDEVRERQVKNMLATLLLSQGVPMILAGDECRRTQHGNNNAYCQDNDISWFDWRLIRKHRSLRRFVQTLIAFRKAEPAVRHNDFLTGRAPHHGGLPDVSWYNPQGGHIDWNSDTRTLGCLLAASPTPRERGRITHHLFLICHAGFEPIQFTFPEIARAFPWSLFIDTAARSPLDVYPGLDGPPPESLTVTVQSRSMLCYVAPERPRTNSHADA